MPLINRSFLVSMGDRRKACNIVRSCAVLLITALCWDVGNLREAEAQVGNKQSGSNKTATQQKGGNDKATDAGAVVARRLPPHFGKLELSDAQREKIYDAQAAAREEIDRLEAELAHAKAVRDAKIEAQLTDKQRSELKTLRKKASDAAKADAKQKSSSSAKKKLSPSNAETPATE